MSLMYVIMQRKKNTPNNSKYAFIIMIIISTIWLFAT